MLLKNESPLTAESASVSNDHSSDNRFQSSLSSSLSTTSSSTSASSTSLSSRSPTRDSGGHGNQSFTSSPHQLLKSVSQQFRQSVDKSATSTQAQHDDDHAQGADRQNERPACSSPRATGAMSTQTKHAPSEQRPDIECPNDVQSVGHSHKPAERSDCITIIHFNDCYNIEPGPKSSGAAGFLTAVNQFRHLEPLILFSGDILSPSFMSTFTKGEQMIPVLNDIGVHCAVFGNHEFDYGVDNLIEFTRRTTFPWLLSNVIDKETCNQLGDGLVYHTLERNGIKFGLIGLIEEEWLSTLSTLELDDVVYTDYVERGRELARWLKGPAHRVDFVIALTHFRTPNDIRLADSVPEIDLILGGHDHDYEIIQRPNCHIIKSGTDFREFSLIKLKINSRYSNTHSNEETTQATIDEKPFAGMDIERIDCAAYPPEPNLKAKLDKFVSTIDEKMGQVLGQFNCELDGRFASIRKYETNLGNFVTDIMLASTHADVAILNSGTLRSDRIHPRGDFTMRDLFNILGYIDPIAVLQANGRQIWKALENGVSQWPKLEGRFPQVSGCSFAFDPSKPPLERINPSDILIGEEPLVLDKQYKLTTKAYLASGKDGYDVLKDCVILVPGDESPDLTTSILNHFEAIRIIKSNRRTHHRQSIICLSRSSIRKILDQTTGDGQSPSLAYSPLLNDGNNNNDFANIDEEPSPAVNGKVPDGLGDRGAIQMRHDNATETINSDASNLNSNADCQQHCCSSPAAGLATPLLSNTHLLDTQTPLDRSPAIASDCLFGSPAGNQTQGARQPRTKRIMSLYEMENEQCKLEPKVEGRIKIYGVNYTQGQES